MANKDLYRLIATILWGYLIYCHFTKPYEFYRVAIIACLGVNLSILWMNWDKEVKDE
jgi:hypothetical protein